MPSPPTRRAPRRSRTIAPRRPRPPPESRLPMRPRALLVPSAATAAVCPYPPVAEAPSCAQWASPPSPTPLDPPSPRTGEVEILELSLSQCDAAASISRSRWALLRRTDVCVRWSSGCFAASPARRLARLVLEAMTIRTTGSSCARPRPCRGRPPVRRGLGPPIRRAPSRSWPRICPQLPSTRWSSRQAPCWIALGARIRPRGCRSCPPAQEDC
mmetsp:Transcript_5357/g.12138  ORF Transcript_5357/g.12138 Transcript_5357/m.12138 type:complete len:214 (-) Transcript_5357:1303-1944(-)